MKDARLFLADIAKVGSDFKDTKSLVAIQKLVISSIASFWSNRIKNEFTPITERSLDVFRSDIESAGVSYLITTDCVGALVELSILQDRLREFSISDHKDEIFRGAVCLQSAKRTDAVSPGDKITPFICRRGCKYYDGVHDVNDGKFKEYCCKGGKSVSITKNQVCHDFESEDPSLPEGVLAV